MSTPLGDAVELLDRSLAYARGALARVDEAALVHPTPCEAWTLGDLLDHLSDSLEAFTEAAGGFVTLRPGAPARGSVTGSVTGSVYGAAYGAARGPGGPAIRRVAGLQERAAALLGAWTVAAPGWTCIGDVPAPTALLVGTAALEITVHGWDVGQATGHGTPVPEDLAARLLQVAGAVVTDDDRGARFAAARPDRSPSYADRLLGFLGRG